MLRGDWVNSERWREEVRGSAREGIIERAF